MFQAKVVEKIKTHILCSLTFFPENRAVYDIMWTKYGRARKATGGTWRMRIARRITKATKTDSKYRIFSNLIRTLFAVSDG